MAVINGTFLPDTLNGTPDDDTINGFGSSDVLSGGDGNDLLDGGNGDDTLNGEAGNDILVGGPGSASQNSVYNGGTGNDLMVASDLGVAENFDGGADNDTVSFAARDNGVTVFLSVIGIPLLDTLQNVENAIGSALNDEITGDGANNHLEGGDGNDVLDGGGGDDVLGGDLGADQMTGGTGNDIYLVDQSGDTVTEFDAGGNDRIIASFDYVLADGTSIEELAAEGGVSAVDLTGNSDSNILIGNAGDNKLDGGGGTDTVRFSGNRADYAVVDNGNGTVTLTDVRVGVNDGSDIVQNVESFEFADGIVALDLLLNAAPVVDLDDGSAPPDIDDGNLYTEGGSASAIGTSISVSDADADMIQSATITILDPEAGDLLSANLPLPTGITIDVANSTNAILVLIGAASAADYATALGQTGYSNSSDDPTSGAAHNSRTISVTVNDGAADSEAALMTMSVLAVDDAAVAFDDTVATDEATAFNGNVFADNGGAGADSDVDGPALAVSKVNGSIADVGAPIILASGAVLTLNSDGTFSYDPHGRFDATPVTGSGASNTPAHDSFNYTLSGGGSATVSVSISGIDGNDTLLGTAGADTLSSGVGNDILNGLGGNDTMLGGQGDDRYFVDQSGDMALEASGEGYDRVLASVSYVLAAGSEIEKLTTSDNFATTPIDLTGNELGQYLFGNAGANSLDGAGGADVMVGLGGDDRYHIDTAADRVIEASGEGYDRVFSAVTWTLQAGSHVDKVTTIDNLATTAINLTGNNLGQYLFGNAGANTLDGGGGGDVMAGLEGDDRYIIRSSADRVIEAAGGGNDRVFAAASFVLQPGSAVETLSTIDNLGTTAINLTGNELGQHLFGNEGANMLDGKLGNDILYGFGGTDTFQFTTVLGANNVDRIADFATGVDKIALDDFIFGGLTAGALDPNAFFVGSAAHDADDRIIYNQTTGALYFDYDGNGVGTAVQFATLVGHPVLAASDFAVI